MSWSSGKESAFGLHVVRSVGDLEVVGLVTTLNATADRVAMHAVRRVLLEATLSGHPGDEDLADGENWL